MSEDMSERMSEDMSERMSEDMSERMSEDMLERMSENMSDRMSECEAWQDHFKGFLKTLHEKASGSQSIFVLLPSLQTGGAKELLAGWLMQRKPQNESQSANAAATMELVEQETSEDQDFIYISPGGQQFTLLQQALQYCPK